MNPAPHYGKPHKDVPEEERPETPITQKIKNATNGMLKANTALTALGTILMMLVSVLLTSALAKLDNLNTIVTQLTVKVDSTQQELADHETRIRTLEQHEYKRP